MNNTGNQLFLPFMMSNDGKHASHSNVNARVFQFAASAENHLTRSRLIHQQQQFVQALRAASEEDLQEVEFAARKIQNSWISNATRRLFIMIVKASGTKMSWTSSSDVYENGGAAGTAAATVIMVDLPVNFLNSVPRRNLETISRILEQRQRQIARELERKIAICERSEAVENEDRVDVVSRAINDGNGNADDDEESNEAVASEVVSEIFVKVMTLSSFSTSTQREESENDMATYHNLFSSHEIPKIQIIQPSSVGEENLEDQEELSMLSQEIVQNIMDIAVVRYEQSLQEVASKSDAVAEKL